MPRPNPPTMPQGRKPPRTTTRLPGKKYPRRKAIAPINPEQRGKSCPTPIGLIRESHSDLMRKTTPSPAPAGEVSPGVMADEYVPKAPKRFPNSRAKRAACGGLCFAPQAYAGAADVRRPKGWHSSGCPHPAPQGVPRWNARRSGPSRGTGSRWCARPSPPVATSVCVAPNGGGLASMIGTCPREVLWLWISSPSQALSIKSFRLRTRAEVIVPKGIAAGLSCSDADVSMQRTRMLPSATSRCSS